MFLLLVWNGFLLSITFQHLCDRAELLILAVQSLTVLHGSTVNTQTWEPGGEKQCSPCVQADKSQYSNSVMSLRDIPDHWCFGNQWNDQVFWHENWDSLLLKDIFPLSWQAVIQVSGTKSPLSHLSWCSIFTHSGLLRRNKFWSIIIYIIDYHMNVGMGLSVRKAPWNDNKGSGLENQGCLNSPSHTLCPLLCLLHDEEFLAPT